MVLFRALQRAVEDVMDRLLDLVDMLIGNWCVRPRDVHPVVGVLPGVPELVAVSELVLVVLWKDRPTVLIQLRGARCAGQGLGAGNRFPRGPVVRIQAIVVDKSWVQLVIGETRP